jgi:phosphopantothenoylcysteine decarboxylase/phosphopantothenate--cysteine ligase
MRRKPVVILTGGPTRAYLDRVRFLTNVSTGAVAFELAKALRARGFRVVAITGPTALPFDRLPLERWVPVETNDEMERAVLAACHRYRPFAAVFSAAVLDFAPARMQSGKRASLDGEWVLKLRPTRKIVDVVGQRHPSLVRVGFKLEWRRESQREARLVKRYLDDKSLDALLVNYLSELGPEHHPARLFRKDGTSVRCSGKPSVARAIAEFLAEARKARLGSAGPRSRRPATPPRDA